MNYNAVMDVLMGRWTDKWFERDILKMFNSFGDVIFTNERRFILYLLEVYVYASDYSIATAV